MMMSVVKKIEKAKNNQLMDGEVVESAVVINDAGAIAGAAVTGGVGGMIGFFVGRKVQNKATDKHQSDSVESEMTKMIPSGQSIVGITNKRVVIYSWDALSGRAKKLVGEMQRGDLTVQGFEKGKMISKLTLSFKDGGKKTYDSLKLNDLEAFQAASK